jgi:hypothetical protein
MKRLKLSMYGILSFLLIGALAFTSCNKEKAAPIVTLSNTAFEGKIGDATNTTVNAVVDGDYKELRITKYIGTTVDNSFGTNGTQTVTSALPYTHNYTLSEEGTDTPIRFQFTVVDTEDQTGEANFVITTKLTLAYVLTTFNWKWDEKRGKLFEETEPEEDHSLECEKDNVFAFNADGTMSIDYGALTAMGGGTCDFDGLTPYVTYEISADETTLTLTKDNVFDPGNLTTEVLTVVSFSLTDIVTTTPVDLTSFGGLLYDWTYTYKAQAK